MNSKFRKIVAGTMMYLTAWGQAHAALTDLATSPLVTSPSSSVLPNLLFILDDSGSMDWDYVPDWANSGTTSLFKNVDYNGQAYDPSVTYSAPTYYNADGTLNTTTYPPQNQTNTQGSCGVAFCSVKNDGYGVQSTSTTDLSGTQEYYTFIPGEYCTSASLRTCVDQAAASATHPFPSVLRWCTTGTEASKLNTASPSPVCQASRVENGTTYTNRRYAGMTRPSATITVTTANDNDTAGPHSTTSVKVNGVEILSATTAGSGNNTASTRRDTNATQIRDNINACTTVIAGNCQTTGWSATVSGSVVTLTPPSTYVLSTITPVMTSQGTMAYSTGSTAGTPGANIRTEIRTSVTSYPYPNTTTKSTGRTDCAGTTCTYNEEMTNYANWYAYYRTRMQMMKTAASIAFAPVDTKYRVGFLTINRNVSGKSFQNVSKFDAAQKKTWYDNFFAANPNNSTPLRQALSTAGRYFAGKLNGTTLSSVTVTEPLQYSCQQNFALLTTDGYWNGTAGVQLDGSTEMGNQDGLEPRPYNDGANLIVTKVTPTATVVTRKSVQNVQRQTPYTRTNYVIGAACSSGTALPTSCRQDDGDNSSGNDRTWCITTTNSGNLSDCVALGAGNIYSCRGISAAGNLPPTGQACQTDSNGHTYCVFEYTGSSNGGNMPSNAINGTCARVYSNNDVRYCRVNPPVTGNQLTTQTQTHTRVEGGAVRTWVDNVTTTSYVTVISTNGIDAPPQNNTPANTVVTTNLPAHADAGQTSYTTDSGAPSGASVWNTTSTSGPACTASASLPAAGPTPALGTAGTAVEALIGSVTQSTLATAGPTVGTQTVTSTSATGGTSNTLADVAEYYYITDLRRSDLSNCTGAIVSPATAGFDVCTNDVAGSGFDTASWQHMTTFGLGMANGVMQYSSTYQSQTSGDYFDVKNGTSANPSSGICGWQSSGSCNWPTPADDRQENIDDLWHAAVNGRGQYFQATNPTALTAGLNSALAGVNARTGSSAAATTSNPNVTSGDNFVFSSTFTTNSWDGQLVRQQLDLVTGVVSASIDWSAQTQLDNLAYASRNIYIFDSSAVSTKLEAFTWANLDPTTQQPFFKKPNIASLSQFCGAGVTCLTSGDQTAAEGQALVNFLRGDRSNEGSTADTTKYFRARSHVLGDIVNAEAVYVKTPLLSYGDTGYSAFVSSQASRQGMVYVAGNDGMLHAFNASSGAEAWAYMPTAVLPNLYKLADKNYTGQHQYFVDGTPVSGDVYDGTNWKTIVVAGLNGGGKAYYALDVTDPANPKALWEFTDTNMGYTYGNPVISKLSNGTWVVFLTSGYNNADGLGHLYVVNALTGALIRDIPTTAGSAATPSGLARINAWVDNTASDNTTLRVYGGDLLGNLWRFDVNNSIAPAGYEAHKLITFYSNDAGTIPQPITTKPELGEVGTYPVIYVGTGKYLGMTDLTDTQKQTFYAVKDSLGTTTLGNARDATATGPKFVQQVATQTTCPVNTPTSICTTGQIVRTSTSNAVNFGVNNGWYVDLPTTGERSNTDPTLALGTLGFTTNIPNTSACTAGGTSFRWLLDYRTGAPVSTSTTGVSSVSLGNALATRAVFVRLPNNTVVQLTRMSDGTTLTTNVPIGSGGGSTRRISWRELISDQ